MQSESGHLRIGELSRRVGISPELLRAWENRYDILNPSRSPGGFRLYSAADEHRVRRMKALLEQGISPAQAARVVANGAAVSEAPVTSGFGASADDLLQALERYDEPAAQVILDRLLGAMSTEAVLSGIVVPTLRVLGERWRAGQITIAQEHFASNVLRGRLTGLARGWGTGTGPAALLACPAGELHDLPLLVFGISLRGQGWRIAFLGADTPIATTEHAARILRPRAVVLTAVAPGPLLAIEQELASLAEETTVALGGRGADRELAERVGALLLEGDPVAAAPRLAQAVAA